MHKYICINTYAYIRIHTYTPICIHRHIHLHLHTYTYKNIYSHMHTYTYTRTYTYMYAHTHSPIYTCIGLKIHMHTRTYASIWKTYMPNELKISDSGFLDLRPMDFHSRFTKLSIFCFPIFSFFETRDPGNVLKTVHFTKVGSLITLHVLTFPFPLNIDLRSFSIIGVG
jgi:hypothetical protein